MMIAFAPLMAAFVLNGCATLGGDTQSRVLAAKNSVAPALVHIRPVKEVFAAGKRTEVLTVGSGFIISPDGYVVTNEHVAGESSQVMCVLSDNSELEAQVVGTDPDTDIAVLKLDVDRNLPHVRLGQSSSLDSGEMVLAMGSPHGLARSVSLGIISVPNRYLSDSAGMVAPYNTWLQTDAAINPGNSGGPLVNLRGEVIGINARVLSGAENVGFAIPVDIAREVIDAIIKNGRVQRGWLGLNFQEMAAKTDDPAQQGVIIADVAPLSPAAEAGVRPGDLLTGINEQQLSARFEEDLPAVRKAIADLPVGASVTVHLSRNNEALALEMQVEEKISIKGSNAEFTVWGFTAAELTPELARRAQLSGRSGVLVTGSQPGSLAGAAGLTQGDIILEMDKTTIESLSQFKQLYEKILETKQPLSMLFVKRGALTRFVLINAEIPQDATLEKEILDHVE